MNYQVKYIDGQLYRSELTGRWRAAEWRNCQLCGQQFAFQHHYRQRGRNTGKYCSLRCSGIALSRTRRTQKSHKQVCVICNKITLRKPSHVDRYKTCGGTRCRNKYNAMLGLRRRRRKVEASPAR